MTSIIEPNQKITKEDLFKLAHNNPIVMRCIDLYRSGTLTWEEALMHCIVFLVEQNNQLEEIAFDKIIKEAPSSIFGNKD